MEAESDIFMKIKLQYNTLSAAHKKLADLVINDPEFILSRYISEVADACDVGDATITRFCKVLGCKGYHDLQMAIVKDLPKNNPNASKSSGAKKDTGLARARLIRDENLNALNDTYHLLDEGTLQKAIDLLTSSERILFFGVGSSQVAALEGYNKFMRITRKAVFNTEMHMQYAAASMVSPRDVAIVISNSGATKEMVEITQLIKKHDAKIICITRNPNSPLTELSDITLLCYSNERIAHGSSLSLALTTQIYLLDLLYAEFFRQNYEGRQKDMGEDAVSFSDD